ncbi:MULTISPECIES: pitrilysin family protein [unclassified Streptomyces]|uniref:M16 family metallopeptidase n=1 Tax=unclassified Streptomyces TaxID=2593676 RepID=UPI002E12394A|nr:MULTISPECIES: pitrilysin family protein [unclassified Streptomyces]WSR29093.1 insulinase family protein [Streptomyces sp. NBC_01205]
MNRNSVLPPIGPPVPVALPPLADVRLDNGLRVIAARHASTPMTELRLAIPLHVESFADAAVQEVLAASLLGHTAPGEHGRADDGLAASGSILSASRSARWLGVAGSGPSSVLPLQLDVLARSLTRPRFTDEVVRAVTVRARGQLAATRAQPQLIASEALVEHLYGPLPQMQDVPREADLAAVGPEQVRLAHHRCVRPDRAALILVGDLDPDRAVEQAARAFAEWEAVGTTTQEATGPLLPHLRDRTIARVPRPGATQTQIRLARPGLARTDPGFAALTLANIVFGGYFSSRLVAEVRERHGLAYRCESVFRDHLDQLVVAVEADTATEHGSRTLDHLRAQLRRMSQEPPTPAEIEAARRFVTGMTALATSSQQGWAGSLMLALATGQQPERISRILDDFTAVTEDDVAAAAGRFFDPDDFHGVVLGDTPIPSKTETVL